VIAIWFWLNPNSQSTETSAESISKNLIWTRQVNNLPHTQQRSRNQTRSDFNAIGKSLAHPRGSLATEPQPNGLRSSLQQAKTSGSSSTQQPSRDLIIGSVEDFRKTMHRDESRRGGQSGRATARHEIFADGLESRSCAITFPS
jgi:hypothetical protein